MFTLNCDRAHLFAHPERELTPDEELRYAAALEERARGVPAQYITGHQEFWGMDLIVTPAVLIPRPETEHLVEAVLEVAAEEPRAKAGTSSGGPLRIADVGTGSGAIAVALAKEFPGAEIYATDVSSAALEIARANAARHQLSDHINFRCSDLLSGLSEGFDVIVSNPPYVGESEEDQVQLEVLKFEPRSAVFAGPVGTEVIQRLVPQAWGILRPGGWLIFEISGTIGESVRNMLRGWDQIQIIPDLQSIPRVARARKP